MAREPNRIPVVASGGAVLTVVAVWVSLTAWTGATYHLAPLVAAATPGFVAKLNGGAGRGRRHAAAAFLSGAAAAAAGWAVILALGIEPNATILENQPGGVPGEVAAGALLGAVIGAALAMTGPSGSARSSSP